MTLPPLATFAPDFAGLEFEDYRFKDLSELMKMKEDKELMFGQVPALQVDGAMPPLGQSRTMLCSGMLTQGGRPAPLAARFA